MADYYTVSSVREYESAGQKKEDWVNVGVAFPHKDGAGFNVELNAVPLNGRLVIRKAKQDEIKELEDAE